MTLNLKTGQNFDIEDENSMPFYSKGIIDPTITAQIQGNPKGLRFLVDSKGRLWAPASMLTSPQNPTNQYSEIATVEPFYSGGNTPQPGVVTHSYIYAVSQSGSNVTPLVVGANQDALYGNLLGLSVQEVTEFYRNGYGQDAKIGAYGTSQLGAPNNQVQLVIDIRDLHSVLSISMNNGGGSSTLEVECSDDGLTNWIEADISVAASSKVFVYGSATVGATTPIPPLAYQFLRITASAPGAGKQVLLDVAVK